MALPGSPADIANMALDEVGERPITSITNPTTPVEILVSRQYDTVREELLRTYVWNFAKKRDTCSRNGTPLFDFADQYALPNDFIRLLNVGGETEQSSLLSYDISGRNLLANNGGASSINIRYVGDVTDVTKWDALFRRLVVLFVALRIAYPLTKKKDVVGRINELINIELPAAISIDGQETPIIRTQRSRILANRMGLSDSDAGFYTIFGE